MSRARLELLIDAARAHGEQSDPDHEVGDLQDMLRDCWANMTPKQRTYVYTLHEDKVTDWVPGWRDSLSVAVNLDALADEVIAKRPKRVKE